MREPKKDRGRQGCGLRGRPDWEASERQTASRGEGRRTRGSGAVYFDKMDADWGPWGLRVENKQTAAASFRITSALLEKAWRQARDMGAFPVMLIDLRVSDDPVVPDRWVVLPESVLLSLIKNGTA